MFCVPAVTKCRFRNMATVQPVYAQVKCGKWGKNEEHLRCIKFATGWTVTLPYWAAVKQGLTTSTPPLASSQPPPPEKKKNIFTPSPKKTVGVVRSWHEARKGELRWGEKTRGGPGLKANNNVINAKCKEAISYCTTSVWTQRETIQVKAWKKTFSWHVISICSCLSVKWVIVWLPLQHPKPSLHGMRNVGMLKDESSTVGNNPSRCVGLHKHTGLMHVSHWWQLRATLTVNTWWYRSSQKF